MNSLILNKIFFDSQKKIILNSLFHKTFSFNKNLYLPEMYLNPTAINEISDYYFISNLFSKIFPHHSLEMFQSIVDTYQINEKDMYLNKKFYRDNFSHMIKVSIIGYKILNLQFNLNGKKKLIDYFVNLTGLEKKELIKIWFLSSLFHDMFQPVSIFIKAPIFKLEPFNIIFKNSLGIEENIFSVELYHFDEYFNELSKFIKNKIIKNKIKNYIKNGKTNDHGIISSYMLYKLAKKENLLTDTFFKNIILHSCRIILFHTCFEKIDWDDNSIPIKDAPLDFYLYLIDKSHECGRKVKDINTTEFKLLEIITSQELRYNDNLIENIYEFTNKTNLENAGFDYRKHIEEKNNSPSRIPKFLKIFNKEEIILPELKFNYNYLDYNSGRIIPYNLSF